ncbi:hypothetical protein HPB47_028254 [Ixodes persulcatus]|uniref:Uncharacterized protein n=1 Tax=Ixodes persulcatus TaxID=34615 RepID=A0AC60PTV0_IXOPE|nr:hypothetical protein HPB47_028254 [Ixodes persulcatus]
MGILAFWLSSGGSEPSTTASLDSGDDTVSNGRHRVRSETAARPHDVEAKCARSGPARKTPTLERAGGVQRSHLIEVQGRQIGRVAGITCIASYMQKLHKDLQLSSPEFKALHFKDPCHLLNNVLDDGLKTDSFVVVHDFVVHFPALLKSSRELRRKFGLVCTSMGMKIKCLSTVSPSRWFSFHEALEDILDYWRAILSFLRSDDAKGKKCEKLKALVSSPDDVHDLLIKLKFLKINSVPLQEHVQQAPFPDDLPLKTRSTVPAAVYKGKLLNSDYSRRGQGKR